MPHVPGLRSPYDKVGRLVYFGRMLDKIRLRQAGKLPPDYIPNFGESRPTLFDGRCCRFLGILFDALVARVEQGGTDDEILAWAESAGMKRSDEECVVWNRFMTKIGWRDDRSEVVRQRAQDSGFTGRSVETMFDLIEYDEGRDPVSMRPWDRL